MLERTSMPKCSTEHQRIRVSTPGAPTPRGGSSVLLPAPTLSTLPQLTLLFELTPSVVARSLC